MFSESEQTTDYSSVLIWQILEFVLSPILSYSLFTLREPRLIRVNRLYISGRPLVPLSKLWQPLVRKRDWESARVEVSSYVTFHHSQTAWHLALLRPTPTTNHVTEQSARASSLHEWNTRWQERQRHTFFGRSLCFFASQIGQAWQAMEAVNVDVCMCV